MLTAVFDDRTPVVAAAKATGWRRVPAVVGASAAALGAVLWLVSGTPVRQRQLAFTRPSPEEQVKGQPQPWRLEVMRQRAEGGSTVVAAGTALRPGDRIRFEITASTDGFAAVVSLDARGVVTAFYPGAGVAVAVSGSEPHLSRHAVALDDAVGAERLILTACERPLPVDQVVAAARRAVARAGGKVGAVNLLELPCEQTSYWLTKVAR